MKASKIIIGIVAAFAAHIALGGYAWFSEEISAILDVMPSKYYPIVNGVELYGIWSNGNTMWRPPNAKINSMTGEVKTESNSVVVNSYASLLNYGKYDPAESLEAYMNSLQYYVTDEWGQGFTYFSDEVSDFYQEYETANMSVAVKAFNQLEGKYEIWLEDIRNKTSPVSYSTEKIAELTKQIDKSLDDFAKQIDDTVKEVSAKANSFYNELSAVKEELTKYAEESVFEAQKQITDAAHGFSSFVDNLADAIESGSFDEINNTIAELNDVEKDLTAAVENLMQSQAADGVPGCINAINNQITEIRNIKQYLNDAVRDGDMEKARGALARARRITGQFGRKNASEVVNKLNAKKSKANAMAKAINRVKGCESSLMNLNGEIENLRQDFWNYVLKTMDNFHVIGAYLASTNSMEYLNWRKTHGKLEDVSEADLDRWFAVKMQEPNFRSQEEKEDYNAFGPLHSKTQSGVYFDTFSRWLADNCFMMYYDLNTAARFSATYGINPVYHDRLRGFYAEEEIEGRNTVTNWYAGHITAPKNWADGTTVVVTNGKFSVNAATNEVEVVTNVLMTVESPAKYGQEGRVTVTLQTMKIKYLTGEPASEKKKINSLKFGSWRGAVFHGDSLTVDSVSAGGATTNVSQISVSEKHDGYDDAISNDDFKHYPQKTNFICQSHSEGVNGTWRYEWIDITGGHIGSNTCATCGGGYSDLTWRHCKYESPSSFQITDGEYILTCEKCGEVVKSPRMAGMRYLDEEYHAEYCFFDYNGVAIRCTPAKNLERHEFPENPEPGMERYCVKCDTICPENTDYIIIDDNVDPYEFDGGSSDWPSGAKKVIFY